MMNVMRNKKAKVAIVVLTVMAFFFVVSASHNVMAADATEQTVKETIENESVIETIVETAQVSAAEVESIEVEETEVEETEEVEAEVEAVVATAEENAEVVVEAKAVAAKADTTTETVTKKTTTNTESKKPAAAATTTAPAAKTQTAEPAPVAKTAPVEAAPVAETAPVAEPEPVVEPEPAPAPEPVQPSVPSWSIGVAGGNMRGYTVIGYNDMMYNLQSLIDQGYIVCYPHCSVDYGVKYFAGHNPGAMSHMYGIGYGSIVRLSNDGVYQDYQIIDMWSGTGSFADVYLNGQNLWSMLNGGGQNAVVIQFCIGGQNHLFYGAAI